MWELAVGGAPAAAPWLWSGCVRGLVCRRGGDSDAAPPTSDGGGRGDAAAMVDVVAWRASPTCLRVAVVRPALEPVVQCDVGFVVPGEIVDVDVCVMEASGDGDAGDGWDMPAGSSRPAPRQAAWTWPAVSFVALFRGDSREDGAAGGGALQLVAVQWLLDAAIWRETQPRSTVYVDAVVASTAGSCLRRDECGALLWQSPLLSCRGRPTRVVLDVAAWRVACLDGRGDGVVVSLDVVSGVDGGGAAGTSDGGVLAGLQSISTPPAVVAMNVASEAFERLTTTLLVSAAGDDDGRGGVGGCLSGVMERSAFTSCFGTENALRRAAVLLTVRCSPAFAQCPPPYSHAPSASTSLPAFKHSA
jgi:hypothetical protein